MVHQLKLWPVPITIVDDFVSDQQLLADLKSETATVDSVAGLNATIQNLDEHKLTKAQEKISSLVTSMVVNYCAENSIDYNNLKFSNFVKSYVYSYGEDSVNNNSYEPHHDMVEQNYLTVCFYLDSAWDGKIWCGGELTIYRELTFATYPANIVNVLPKPNRLVIFPGFVNHRVKPYFGSTPRVAFVFAWSVRDATPTVPLTI